ncbi:hypothetical protein A8L51_21605 [Pantoea stewartii]|nr:hypothetical protein [Pantoea stewartii]
MLGKPTAVRVIITEQIIVKPRFAVQVLALHTQVLLYHRNSLIRFAQQFAPRAVHTFPGLLAFNVGQSLGRPIRGAVEPEYLRTFHAINTGQWLIALAVAVNLSQRNIVVDFLQQSVAFPHKPRCYGVTRLLDL